MAGPALPEPSGLPMAELPAALAAGSGRFLAWRIDARAYAASWAQGIGAERFGGRWNPKGLAVVYASLDPATCLVESAVHRGFAVLDAQPHVLSCLEVEAAGAVVVGPERLPNPAWLHGGVPGAGQQRFGAGQLLAHGVVLLPSAVSKPSWNLVFTPEAVLAGRVRLRVQQPLVVDVRLNPPT